MDRKKDQTTKQRNKRTGQEEEKDQEIPQLGGIHKILKEKEVELNNV